MSRAGAGRAAARQRREAHLEARGADSLLVLRHSQRPDGDARRRLHNRSFGARGGGNGWNTLSGGSKGRMKTHFQEVCSAETWQETFSALTEK